MAGEESKHQTLISTRRRSRPGRDDTYNIASEGVLTSGGIWLGFETFSVFKSALEEIFSPSAASVILYETARKCGKCLCEKIMEKTRRKEEVLRLLSKLKSEEKWGKISFRDIDYARGSGRVLIFDSFETLANEGSRLGCHFLRGFLSGFLSKLFEKKNITAVETKCASKGYKYCEFRFASSFALYAEQARQVVESVIREAALKYPSDIQ